MLFNIFTVINYYITTAIINSAIVTVAAKDHIKPAFCQAIKKSGFATRPVKKCLFII